MNMMCLPSDSLGRVESSAGSACAALERLVAALGGRVAALGGLVAALGGLVAALGGRVAALGGLVAVLGGRVAALAGLGVCLPRKASSLLLCVLSTRAAGIQPMRYQNIMFLYIHTQAYVFICLCILAFVRTHTHVRIHTNMRGKPLHSCTHTVMCFAYQKARFVCLVTGHEKHFTLQQEAARLADHVTTVCVSCLSECVYS